MLTAACPDPERGASAEIVPRAVADGTDGPVAHVRTLCVNKHRYLPPDAMTSCALRDVAAATAGQR